MSRADDEARFGVQADDELEEEHRRALRAEGSKLAKPKPTGNVCSSCVPILLPTPSGRIRLKHLDSCKEHPGEWIATTEYAKNRAWLPRRRW